MGKGDVLKHTKTQLHQELAVSRKSQSKLKLSSSCSSEVSQIIEAEVRMAVLTACSNVPLAFHDHLSPLIRKVFPDSNVASRYHSASTKATCMLNLAIAPMLKENLIANMRIHPFSVSIDAQTIQG